MKRIVAILVAVLMVSTVGFYFTQSHVQTMNTGRLMHPNTLSSNSTLLYEFKLYNNGSAFTNGAFPFYFTNESLFDFNTTGNVVQNVKFLYSNGTQIKGFVPTGQYNGELLNTKQPNGKWVVYFTNVSMPAQSNQTIYMQVFPRTTSQLNANMSTTTTQNINLSVISFTNKAQTWIHSAVNSYTINPHSMSVVATGSGPTKSSLNFTINFTVGSKGIAWQYAQAAQIGGGSLGSNFPQNSIFGNWTYGYGTGISMASTPSWAPLYKTSSGITVSGSTTTAAENYTSNATYKNGYFNFTTYAGTIESVQFTGTFGGNLTNDYSSNPTYFNDLITYVPFKSIGQKNLGTVTSITPTSTGNYILTNEHGLPGGQTWTMNFINKSDNVNQTFSSTTNSVKAFLPTGYLYNFTFNTFDSSFYHIINKTGQITLPATANATINVTAINITYEAIFHESGLASGTKWSVTTNGTLYTSTASTDVALLKNGSYTWTLTNLNIYTSNRTKGYDNITGANVNIYIGFTYTAFNITFHEIGLPKGTAWSLVINGTTYKNNSDGLIYFLGKVGTYVVKVNNASFYTPIYTYANFTLTGNANISITFAIALTFVESGLPSGTKWSVTVGGTTYYSTTNTIVVKVAPGFITYEIGGVPSGYTVLPLIQATTNFTGPTQVNITFQQSGMDYAGILGSIPIVAAVMLAGIGLFVYLFYRRFKR